MAPELAAVGLTGTFAGGELFVVGRAEGVGNEDGAEEGAGEGVLAEEGGGEWGSGGEE